MPRHVRSPESEFSDLADLSTARFEAPFLAMMRAVAQQDTEARERARRRLATVIGDTMAMADLLGRRRAILEFKAVVGASFDLGNPIIPKVPFAEAIEDIVRREPMLAGTAEEVAALYRQKHAFALARSAEQQLTSAVQRVLTSAFKEGRTSIPTARIIAEMGDWTRSYGAVVYRTNLNTAYTAGRMQQAREPVVRKALPAFERFSVRDSAVRQGRKRDGGENHLAAHGLLADTQDPVWAHAAPPSGYACRCSLRLVSAGELQRRGLLDGTTVLRYEPPSFAQFAPHPNFGKERPEVSVYVGTIG
jgi:hypothetical protein